MKKTPRCDFFCQILSVQLRNIKEGRLKVLESADPEALHKLRVATLRADFALKLFGKYSDDGRIEGLRRQLKRGRRAMGSVRDMDVAQSHAPENFERAMRSRHEYLRRELTELLTSPWFTRVTSDLESLSAGAPHVPGRKRRKFLRAALKKVLRTGGRKPDAGNLHRVRKAFKELRYTAEFLSGFENARMRKTMRAIVKFQDILGKRQDAIIICDVLSHGERPANRLIRHEQKVVRRSEKKFRRHWKSSLPVLRARVAKSVRHINLN